MELFLASIAIMAAGVFLGFFVQTIIGFAATVIALPVLLFVVGIKEAISLMAIFLFAFSLILIRRNWRAVDKKMFSQLVVTGIFGLALGTFLLKYGSPVLLKKLLGVFIFLVVGYSYISTRKIRLFNRLGFLFGFLGGLFSGLFNTGGPLYATYINNKLSNPKTVRATVIGILAMSNFIRMPFLIYGGLITRDLLMKALFAFPFFLLSLYLGHRFFNKLNDAMFKNVFMFFLLLSGLSLIFR